MTIPRVNGAADALRNGIGAEVILKSPLIPFFQRGKFFLRVLNASLKKHALSVSKGGEGEIFKWNNTDIV
jgi:hypothetical protein